MSLLNAESAFIMLSCVFVGKLCDWVAGGIVLGATTAGLLDGSIISSVSSSWSLRHSSTPTGISSPSQSNNSVPSSGGSSDTVCAFLLTPLGGVLVFINSGIDFTEGEDMSSVLNF